MEKKFKIRYGSTTEKVGEGFRIQSDFCGLRIVELFEMYESWNSQYRSKECIKGRENIKKSIFQMLYSLDESLILQNTHYEYLIESGVSEDDIDYDMNKIEEDMEGLWNVRNRKSFKEVK